MYELTLYGDSLSAIAHLKWPLWRVRRYLRHATVRHLTQLASGELFWTFGDYTVVVKKIS